MNDMIVQPIISGEAPFITSGEASLIINGYYRLAYSGSSINIGDAIKVCFPMNFTSTNLFSLGSDDFLPIKNLSGRLISKINAGYSVILTYAGDSWVAQFLSIQKGQATYEFYSAGSDVQPSASCYWHNSNNSNRYILASTSSTYLDWISFPVTPATNGERIIAQINLTAGSGKNSSNSVGGTYANHRLTTNRNGSISYKYIASNGNDQEGNIINRVKAHRGLIAFRQILNSVSVNETIVFTLGGYGSRWGYIDGTFIVCSYNVMIAHYPA